jgi:hypothetical protein
MRLWPFAQIVWASLLPLARNIARVSGMERLVHDSIEVSGVVGEVLCVIRNT